MLHNVYFRTLEPKAQDQNLSVVCRCYRRCRRHFWLMSTQICSNEGTLPFPRRDNYAKAKIYWRNLKIFFSRTAGPISTKFGTKHPLVKGIQLCSNEEPLNSHKVNNCFFLFLINIMIIICFYWFKLFSHMSDVAHGPLVSHWLLWILHKRAKQKKKCNIAENAYSKS